MIHIVDLQTMTEIDRSTLQARFPGTSFPMQENLSDAILQSFNCATFTVDAQPSYSPFSNATPGPIVKDSDGKYRMHWIQTDATLNEAQQQLLNLVHQRYTSALQMTIQYESKYVFTLDLHTVVLLRESAAENEVATLSDNQGTWLQLQPTDATALANTISSMIRTINVNMYNHVAAIKALADINAAKAYDITVGWPT